MHVLYSAAMLHLDLATLSPPNPFFPQSQLTLRERELEESCATRRHLYPVQLRERCARVHSLAKEDGEGPDCQDLSSVKIRRSCVASLCFTHRPI